jgi:hypothetical protein
MKGMIQVKEHYSVRYEFQRGAWHFWGFVNVKASSEQEAKEMALPIARKKNPNVTTDEMVICRNGFYE